MQQPSIGRTVHYRYTEDEEQGGDGGISPAVITEVYDPRMVKLTVFAPDGTTHRESSIILVESDTNDVGQCFWPPRVNGPPEVAESPEGETAEVAVASER